MSNIELIETVILCLGSDTSIFAILTIISSVSFGLFILKIGGLFYLQTVKDMIKDIVDREELNIFQKYVGITDKLSLQMK